MIRTILALFAALSLVACASAPQPTPPSTARAQPAPAALSPAIPVANAEMRIDFAHFQVMFGAQHSYLTFMDSSSGEDVVLFRLHSTSVETKRRASGYYYEFRENIGPCLKQLPFYNLSAKADFFPDFTGSQPLTLSDDSALFQNRKTTSQPIYAGSREDVMAMASRIVALAAVINEASLDYSFRGDDAPNCNSALFSILRKVGLGGPLQRAAADSWFPGEETPISLPDAPTPTGAAASALRAALKRLQGGVDTVSGNEPCAAAF